MADKKILITRDNETFLYNNGDVHTKYGFISKKEIENASEGQVLKTNKGKSMAVLEPQFIDIYKKLKRSAQIMLPKDITAIIGATGINKRSKVLDAGSGSGGNACFIAAIAKKVYTYDNRKDHLDVVRKNIAMLGLKNISVKEKDVYEKVDEKGIDVAIIDLAEPWRAADNVYKALKPGGFMAAYSPQISQVARLVEHIENSKKFIHIKTIEIIEREWEVSPGKLRPKFQMLGHTAFICITRKIHDQTTAEKKP